MKNEIILFENQNVKLEVNMKDETVWLNREQLAELFDRDVKTIGKHINNALKEELDNSTVAKFATVQTEGNRKVTRDIEYYNLDMIISVGYRVKSQNGIIFRKWANKVLKDYMLQGYAVNQKRLEYLEKTVKLIDIANRIDENLNNSDAQEILKVIGNYSKALDLLDDYDHRTLLKPKGNDSQKQIKYEDCLDVINKLRFNQESSLFAIERNNGLEAIINNIYQTFDNNDVYKSIEEKASNFLYMIVKNHVFIDGNKRIAATLFIYFLNYILFLILGFTVVKPFYASQIGSADVEIMDMGIDYLSTVMIFSFGLFAQVMFERMLTSTGRTIFSRKVYL